MKKLLIIKLGGSVVTFKDSSLPKLRTEVIQSIAKEIKKLSEKYQIILVHGAGSFGHPIAKKYALHKGMQTEEQRIGFSLLSETMISLNQQITHILIKETIPVISFSPHSFIEQVSGQLVQFDIGLIEHALQENFIPLLYGDVVFDQKWKSSILSGDTIIAYLAKKLNPEKIIFLTDVDGIFDSDPKRNPDAHLFSKITDENLEEVLQGITSNNPDDVTGEMRGKILEIKNSLSNLDVFIINGLKNHSLVDSVADQLQIGTHLLLK